MTREEIHAEIVRSMSEMFEIEPSRITLDAHLITDLELDSIDAIDMAVKVQELTGKRVDDQSLRSLRTIGDVVSMIEGLSK